MDGSNNQGSRNVQNAGSKTKAFEQTLCFIVDATAFDKSCKQTASLTNCEAHMRQRSQAAGREDGIRLCVATHEHAHEHVLSRKS